MFSGVSGTGSEISETSKKSRKRTQNKSKQKLRKKRVVKEGSPFEEDYLIELLKDIKVTQGEKDEV